MPERTIKMKSGKITSNQIGGRNVFSSLTITGSTGEITNTSLAIVNGDDNTVSATIPAPKPGWFLTIWCPNADNAVTVTLDAGTWDGTDDVATFPASSGLTVIGVSSTRFMIIENVNTVTFS